MAVSKKKLVGGATVAVVAAAAFHVHNNVIPDYLAEELNAAFDDAYGQSSYNAAQGVEIIKSGLIEVEADGLLGYRASFPETSIMISDEGKGYNITIEQTDYDVDIKDNLTSIDFDILYGSIKSSDVVNFSVFWSDGISSGSANGKCLSVENQALIASDNGSDGILYDIKTIGSVCEISGDVISEITNVSGKFDTEFKLTSQVSRGSVDAGYSGRVAAEFDAINISSYIGGQETAKVSFAGVDLHTKYSGLNSKDSTADAMENVPNDFEASFSANDINLVLNGTGATVTNIAKNISSFVSVSGLNDDRASLDFGLAYKMSPETAKSSLGVENGALVGCQFEIDNLAADDLRGIVRSDPNAGTAATGVAKQQMATIINEFMAVVLAEENVAVKSACIIDSEDSFKAVLKSDNVLDEGLITGSGSLEIYDVDELAKTFNMLVDPNQVQNAVNIFKALSKPTEDGKGLKIDYELDEQGQLKLNGTPMQLQVK
jgi:hypothetical protein